LQKTPLAGRANGLVSRIVDCRLSAHVKNKIVGEEVLLSRYLPPAHHPSEAGENFSFVIFFYTKNMRKFIHLLGEQMHSGSCLRKMVLCQWVMTELHASSAAVRVLTAGK